MMQPFRLGDVLRCLLLNAPRGPNLACPWEGVSGGTQLRNSSLWKETLAQRRARVTIASWAGLHLEGLASARVRSGHRAWEIDRMFLADGPSSGSTDGRGQLLDSETVTQELIECIVEAMGEFRVERFFLRIPHKSPVAQLARRAGFFPYFEESLWEGSAGPLVNGGTAHPVGWRELSPQDSFALFQLYCSATPQTVRAAVGMTFDQWRDSQEIHWGRRQDWVTNDNDKIIGWLRLSHCRKVTGVEFIADPDNSEVCEALVDRTVHQGGLQRWLVPDYQKEVPGLLLRRRYQEVGRYSMMIKTVTVPVTNPGMVPVEA